MKLHFLKKIQEYYTQINKIPPKYWVSVGAIVDKFPKVFSKTFSVRRFFSANRIKTLELSDLFVFRPAPKVELLFLATKKDFDILKFSVKSALIATSQYERVHATIVDPDRHLQESRMILANLIHQVKIVPESLLIEEQMLEMVKEVFKSRAGWVKQQLLKLSFVCASRCDGVLIVDADTVLLRSRPWLDDKGCQLLTPTWEYHLPYYEFLNSIGICEIEPEYSFVSHHMLMQPKILKEIFNYAGWSNIQDLINLVCAQPNSGDNSPFSLDYELYAQYLYTKHPDKVVLSKWSNKALSRNLSSANFDLTLTSEVIENSNKFASLSFHSYL